MGIKEKIEKWVEETLEVSEVILVHPKEIKNGDYTLIINDDKAEEYFEKLKANLIPEIKSLEFVKPRFINVYLSEQFFADAISEINKEKEKFGQTDLYKNKKMIIEYTDPNPFKEFHIGHLMPNVIGESLSRIIECNGSDLKRVNYQGDVGLHVAKAIWGKLQKPELAWGEAYAYGSTHYESNKEKIDEINKKIYEKSDEEINKLYKDGKQDSLDRFEILYKQLGTKFDRYFFESEVGEFGKKTVLDFVAKGIFEESEGAIVFRGEKFNPKLHTRVFVSSQGLPVYEAKELGLSKIKYDFYPYDLSIIVTGNEINEYFKVLITAMGQVFPDLAQKTKHLSHGMLRLPTGKMSSRTGDVVTAESLISQVKEKVKEKIVDREFGDDEKENIAEVVAIGAIKYSILRQAIGGDIVFDFDKSISFEGDSGPYLQYTAVRATSVLEKAGLSLTLPKGEGTEKPPEDWLINEVEKILYRFPEVVERAGKEYAPHHLVTYLTELASAFNSFYGNTKIISENDPTSLYKIALTQAVAHALTNGLNILGIKLPKKM